MVSPEYTLPPCSSGRMEPSAVAAVARPVSREICPAAVWAAPAGRASASTPSNINNRITSFPFMASTRANFGFAAGIVLDQRIAALGVRYAVTIGILAFFFAGFRIVAQRVI